MRHGGGPSTCGHAHGRALLVVWVAVKELKLSYHNGYIQ